MILIIIVVIITISYVSMILAFTIGLKRVLNESVDESNESIKLSVVVAFRNEVANLPILLNVLSDQTLNHELFELILVDDHSTDDSLSSAQSNSSIFQNLRIISSPIDSHGKKAALAFGIKKASNPLIVFTDADCVPTKYWLESIYSVAAKGSSFIIGAVAMSPTDSFARKLQALEYSSLMASAAGSCGVGHPIIASSANLAFRNDLLNVDFESMSPAIASGDDMFLLHRAKKIKNGRIEFLNDVLSIVQTTAEQTIANTLGQRKRWASKSINYKDFDTIYAGLVVLVFNLMILLLLLASVFSVNYLFYSIILLVVKSFVDYRLISRYLKFTCQDELLRIFLPLQLVYPFYVVYSFAMGIFEAGNWKGRRIN